MSGMPVGYDDDWPDTVGFADSSPSAVEPLEEIPVHPDGFTVRRPVAQLGRGRKVHLPPFTPVMIGPVLAAGAGAFLASPADISVLSVVVVSVCGFGAGIVAAQHGGFAGWLAAVGLTAGVWLSQTWALTPVLIAAAVMVASMWAGGAHD